MNMCRRGTDIVSCCSPATAPACTIVLGCGRFATGISPPSSGCCCCFAAALLPVLGERTRKYVSCSPRLEGAQVSLIDPNDECTHLGSIRTVRAYVLVLFCCATSMACASSAGGSLGSWPQVAIRQRPSDAIVRIDWIITKSSFSLSLLCHQQPMCVRQSPR